MKFLDLSVILCMKIRDMRNDFFRPFLGTRFSSYFASALITVHLTPTKTEALKRKWGSLYGSRMDEWEEGQTTQLPLGTCSAPLPERFSLISRSLGATWRARASFLNRQEEKHECARIGTSEWGAVVIRNFTAERAHLTRNLRILMSK